LADRIAEQTTTNDSYRAHQTPYRRTWAAAIMHRWPTALGIAVAALTAFDLDDGTEFAALTVLMALVYLGAAALDRRWSAWVVLLAGLPIAFFIPSAPGVVPSVALLVAALVFLALGVARGQWQRPGGLPLQSAGMLVFGSAALVALYVDMDLGGRSWPWLSSATPPGTLTTCCETGWSRARTRSSVPLWTTCWARPSSS
jgi:hypothetical protein